MTTTFHFLQSYSLGLHSMEHGRDCHINIRSATHNIIGLGIKTLTMFPIDSSKSTQASLVYFRQQFQHFIKNTVNSKINDHLSKHGPDPDLYPVLRSSLARELSIWTTLRDKNPASLHAPTWSDYAYVRTLYTAVNPPNFVSIIPILITHTLLNL